MEDKRIDKRIYDWALHKARGNCSNSFFRDHGLGIHGENVSSCWCKNEILPKIETILVDQFKCRWHNNINSEQGPSKKGRIS